MDYSYLTSCEQIMEDDFRSAAATKPNTEAFLQKVEEISKPQTGAGKILFFFARLALRNEQMAGTAKHIYQSLALQISRSRRSKTLFEIRLMHDVGGIYEQLYKVTMWCEFDELLQASRDRKNLNPFVCVQAKEDFLLFEASGEDRENSLPPPAYAEADARYRELEAAGMLKPSQMIPTIPPPDEGPDPNEDLAYALVGGDISEIPTSPAISEPPAELISATVSASSKPPPRSKFESWAEEAEYLAQREPSLAKLPTQQGPVRDEGIGQAIGRISLAKIRSDDSGPQNKLLRDRPATQRPPAIEEDEDPGLPLVNAGGLAKDEPIDKDAVDDGWGDLLPIVNPRGEKK